MNKDLELYHEEQRASLLDIEKSIKELSRIFSDKVAVTAKMPEDMQVNGTVSVNNDLTVKNINDIQSWLADLGEVVSKAIKENSYQPKDSIEVSNLKEVKIDELKINNLDDLKTYFSEIKTAIIENQPIVNVAKQDIQWPNSPRQPIAVRLSDGKEFYKAVSQLISGGGGTPKQNYDYVDIQQTNPTTDTYVFKTGGSGGTTVRTVTVVYTSSAKTDLDNVSWS